MCAALSSYVHACAARGIALDGWREVTCSELLSFLKGLRIFDSCQQLDKLFWSFILKVKQIKNNV